MIGNPPLKLAQPAPRSPAPRSDPEELAPADHMEVSYATHATCRDIFKASRSIATESEVSGTYQPKNAARYTRYRYLRRPLAAWSPGPAQPARPMTASGASSGTVTGLVRTRRHRLISLVKGLHPTNVTNASTDKANLDRRRGFLRGLLDRLSLRDQSPQATHVAAPKRTWLGSTPKASAVHPKMSSHVVTCRIQGFARCTRYL